MISCSSNKFRLIYEKLPCEVAVCEKFTEVVALFLYLGLGPPVSFQCTGTELDSCSSPPLENLEKNSISICLL